MKKETKSKIHGFCGIVAVIGAVATMLLLVGGEICYLFWPEIFLQNTVLWAVSLLVVVLLGFVIPYNIYRETETSSETAGQPRPTMPRCALRRDLESMGMDGELITATLEMAQHRR